MGFEGFQRRDMAVGARGRRAGRVAPPAHAVHVRQEIEPLDVLHREEPLALVADQFVQGDEVGVVEIRQRPEFPLEAVDAGGVDAQQRLEGDQPAEPAIAHQIHGTHAAATQLALHLEALCAGKPSQGVLTTIKILRLSWRQLNSLSGGKHARVAG